MRCNSQSKAVAHSDGILRGLERIVLRISDDSDSTICNLALLLVQELSELLVCGRRNHERIAKLIVLSRFVHCAVIVQVLDILIIVVYRYDDIVSI